MYNKACPYCEETNDRVKQFSSKLDKIEEFINKFDKNLPGKKYCFLRML